MCQFNIILTEKDTNSTVIEKLLNKNGFGYSEIKNESINSQTKELQTIIVSTKGHCDCGSILGTDQSKSAQTFNIEKERKKLKKKKWTDSKIERYLADKLKSQAKNEENKELGNSAEEDRWMKLINQLIDERIKFGILHHQFSGSLDEEKIEFKDITTLTNNELSIERLRNLRDCELLRIT
jgi:hypothetical protein